MAAVYGGGYVTGGYVAGYIGTDVPGAAYSYGYVAGGYIPVDPVVPPPPGPLERAISVSGAEFTPFAGGEAGTTSMAFSNVNVGTYDSDYKYEGVPSSIPSANRLTFDYLYGRGFRTVKIPIRWERIQRTLGGALDTTEVARLTKELDMAGLAGLEVVLDIHNYGLYFLDGSQTSPTQTTNTGYRFPIGSATVTQAHFADLWSRMATSFAAHSAVIGFHLMNEPQAAGGLTRSVWYSCSQAAVTAIRAVSTTVTIRVGGWHWSDVYQWATQNPSGPWITDATGLTWYEGHHYFSQDNDGNYTTYADALADAATRGYTAGLNADALHTRVLDELQGFADWLTTFGRIGVVGETSVPGNAGGDQAAWNALLDVYLARCEALGLHVDAWSTGEFYGTSSDPLLFYVASSGSANGVNSTRANYPPLEAHLVVVGASPPPAPGTYGAGVYGSGLYGVSPTPFDGSGLYYASWSSLDDNWYSPTVTWNGAPPPLGPKPTTLSIGVWELLSGTTWAKVHEIRTWTTFAVEPRYNDPGVWSLTMPFNTQAESITKGRLLTFDLVRDSGSQRLMTGVVSVVGPASGETGGVSFEASGMGALGLLGDVLIWPSPAEPIDGQKQTHYTSAGPTETVLRNVINLNMVTRRGDDLIVAASQGRGKAITLKERFTNLLEVVSVRARAANLGVRIGLVRTTSSTRAELRLEFFRPTDVSQRVRLSSRVGSLRTWKQTDTAPTGTRALCAATVQMTPLGIEFINLADDKMTTTTNTHTLQTGAKLLVEGAKLPGGLSAGTTYFVIRVDADTIQVAESRSKALKGTPVKITTAGIKVEKVNITPNAITITKGDVPDTGSRIRFYGDAPAPLNPNTVYYAIKVDRDTFKAANTLAAANNGNEINLTNDGSGSIYVYEAGSVQVVEVARTIRQVVATGGVEAEWGRKIETFVDASGEDLDDMAELLEKGTAALAEMTAQSGFELEAVESEGVKYGKHFDLGDTVAVELMTGLSRTDQLNAVQVEGGSGGINVKLIPGQPDAASPLFKQADIIRRLRRDIRALQREEG